MAYQLYIAGEFTDAAAGRKESVHNPATGEHVADFAFGNVTDALRAMDAAENAFSTWKKTTAYERAPMLHAVAGELRKHAEKIARTMSLENGKPLVESRAEVLGSAGWFEWFAEEAKRNYGRIVPPSTTAKRVMVIQQPVGVVVSVTPWNFPVNLMTRKLAAALAAGCTLVCRPASETPLSAMQLFECMHEAGLPPGTANLVTGEAGPLVEAMINHRACRKLAFTGSTPVGKSLMKQAADRMIRVSLELGGHAPVIVFPDIDVEFAAEQTVVGKFRNAGQSCISPSRIYVHQATYDKFRHAVVERTKKLRVGNGLDNGIEMGPLLNEKQLRRVEEFVRDAVEKGAKILTGGDRLKGGIYDAGCFFAPTVMENLSPTMRLTCEEMFGPVLPLFPFEDTDAVIRAANDTPFGLAAYVLTRNLDTAIHVSESLDYGIVGVNDVVPTVPNAPFGGWKESGVGREGGREGLDAYLETKFISLGLS